MYRPISAIIYSSVFAFAGLFSTGAAATEVCDLYTTAITTCSRDCYLFVTPVITAECDLTEAVTVKEASISDPPPAPILKCSHSAGVSTCEAFPQSEELSYSWSDDASTGTAQVSSPEHSFACGAGNVSVSIMTSAGATSVASTTIPACN